MHILNDDNFILYAMKLYDNPQCKNIEEFNEDIDRIKYIKRLLYKYINKGVLREKLVLNHIIVLGNLFTPLGCTKMLFHKLDKDMYPQLKSFLSYLNYLPEEIEGVNLKDIEIDIFIIKKLKEI
jgi:hypothetical protein